MKIRKSFSLIITRICFLILCGFSLSVLFITSEKVVKKQFTSDREQTETEKIDWLKLYPFESPPISPELSKLSKLKNLQEKILKKASEHILFYHFFLETANRFEVFMKWNLAPVSEYNPVVKMEENYLVGLTPKKDSEKYSRSVIAFYDYLRRKSLPLYFIQLPHKICKNDYLSGTADFFNQNADALLYELEKTSLPILDLRKSLHEDNLNHHDCFFDTDHHWKPETGLWATEKIIRMLSENSNLVLDSVSFRQSDWEIQTLPNLFLGSLGKKATLAKCHPDNFSLIYPKKSCDLYLTVYSQTEKRFEGRGDFSIIYDREPIDSINYYNKNPYAAYVYGDNISRFINFSSQNETSVLMFGDSYAEVVRPFLALSVRRLDYIDIRHFNGSVKTFIDRHTDSYDGVLFLSQSYTILDNLSSQFYPLPTTAALQNQCRGGGRCRFGPQNPLTESVNGKTVIRKQPPFIVGPAAFTADCRRCRK